MSPLYLCFRAKQEINPLYFEWYFRSSVWHRYIYMSGDSGARYDRVSIKDDTFFAMPINIPTAQEQDRIALSLNVIEQRIDKQRSLVESLKKYKRGLLCQLISGKCSSLQKHNWNIVKLGDVFMERNERATGGEELLAVTINAGVQRRSEIDLKDNSSDDKSNYKRVMRGDIAYNTMRMWQGASGASNYDGIVSPAYTVITPIHPHQINIRFWAQYFKYEPLVKTFQKFSQGLTSDTWNLKFPQFAEIKVYYPPYDIQNEVANFLMSFDERIRSEEETLRQLNRLKLSLYAQLFI